MTSDDRLHLLHASHSEMGRRSGNDDALLVDPQAGIYAVCDGARGRFGGRTAAELAVDAMQPAIPEVAREADAGLSPVVERAVEKMMMQAHGHILSAQASDPALEGMTTTAAMVVHRGRQVLVSHVGDTRVYLYREGQLELLTTDHNLENYLKENPNFKPKVRLSGKTLVRALGLKTSMLKVDHRQLALQKDDLLLINTDGLTDSLPTLSLASILGTVRLRPLEEVTHALVRAALSHGTTDNVSVILLQFSDKVAEGPRTTVFELDAVPASQSQQLVLGWLVFLDPPHHGRVVPLEASTVIGADPDCKIVVAEDYVSGRHAEVMRTEHGFTLRDLGSTNGTFINNGRAQEECLVDGDRIRVGRTEMVFKSHSLER
jgi:PPM family protein phosphatase